MDTWHAVATVGDPLPDFADLLHSCRRVERSPSLFPCSGLPLLKPTTPSPFLVRTTVAPSPSAPFAATAPLRRAATGSASAAGSYARGQDAMAHLPTILGHPQVQVGTLVLTLPFSTTVHRRLTATAEAPAIRLLRAWSSHHKSSQAEPKPCTDARKAGLATSLLLPLVTASLPG